MLIHYKSFCHVKLQNEWYEKEIVSVEQSVLRQPRNWCVQSEALYLRSQWEWDSVQRMERSISQLEVAMLNLN